MGNTPRVSCWRRIPAKECPPRAVNDMDLEILGSAHGVPTDALCLWWVSMPIRESNSLLQWAHWKPNDSGNCSTPLGCPLPAPRRMLWMAFNLQQFSGPIDVNVPETETEHDTINKRTTLCIATDRSAARMCTHHGQFHILNDKQPKCQKVALEINENNMIKSIKSEGVFAANCKLTKNVMYAHAQCKTLKICMN